MMQHCDLGPLSVYVDKLTVRDFVTERIGSEYLIPLIGAYDQVDDIDFASLPRSFVLKATHGSGWNVLVMDKSSIDWDAVLDRVNGWLRRNYYKYTGQSNYRGIKGRIIIEEFLHDLGGDLRDYKFYCCNGEVQGVQVDFDRFRNHQYRLYDCNWDEFSKNNAPAGIHIPQIPRPAKLNEMLEIARSLSRGFPHVRVDLYYPDGNIYFGELTFTTGGGRSPFDPIQADFQFGEPFDVRSFLAPPVYQGRWPLYRQK